MNNFLLSVLGWFGFGSRALSEHRGLQVTQPNTALIEDTRNVGIDGALQLSAVWACVDLLTKIIATLPLFVYDEMGNGQRTLARTSTLWALLHDSPNSRMTPSDFWRALLLNLCFRGNAYARIERGANGEAYAMWPMFADQVQFGLLPDGSAVYYYRMDQDIAVLAEENVLHLKDMGNGTMGLAKLDYMRATVSEAANAQTAANKLFANGGKPTGILMVDNVLNPEQRAQIKSNFAEMASGSIARLFVLEANMKYQQVNLSPQDMELLATRKHTTEEIGRWYGVPGVLINDKDVSTWGAGIEQIIEGFFKFTIQPAAIAIEQAVRKRVLTAKQRATQSAEFSFDALLRMSLKDRAMIYSQLTQNGIKTRNECRQLENDPPLPGGDVLTAQVNLAPLPMLGKITGGTQNATSSA